MKSVSFAIIALAGSGGLNAMAHMMGLPPQYPYRLIAEKGCYFFLLMILAGLVGWLLSLRKEN